MQVTLEIPDEMALLLEGAGGRADRGLLLEAAASLVARGRISSGRTARLLGMERLDFLNEMTRRKLSVVDVQHWAQEDASMSGMVVSNTTPLSTLARVDCLAWIFLRWKHVTLPAAVWLRVPASPPPGSRLFRTSSETDPDGR